MVQEIKLMKNGWEVDLSQISPGVVYIWHGTTDTNVPVSNAYKNAKAIPGAHLEIFEGAGHTISLFNMEKLFEILGS
jgi:pimeloyl-ACP methyl ester carboxylesterase